MQTLVSELSHDSRPCFVGIAARRLSKRSQSCSVCKRGLVIAQRGGVAVLMAIYSAVLINLPT